MRKKSNLGVELWIVRHDDEVVYGVEAEADDIELSGKWRLEGKSHACSSTKIERECSNFSAKGEMRASAHAREVPAGFDGTR
jgi:hypothetical protein